jgi:hypothetical protein
MPSTVVHIFNETTNMPKVGKDFSLYFAGEFLGAVYLCFQMLVINVDLLTAGCVDFFIIK